MRTLANQHNYKWEKLDGYFVNTTALLEIYTIDVHTKANELGYSQQSIASHIIHTHTVYDLEIWKVHSCH